LWNFSDPLPLEYHTGPGYFVLLDIGYLIVLTVLEKLRRRACAKKTTLFPASRKTQRSSEVKSDARSAASWNKPAGPDIPISAGGAD
jgi:hypothetical protein